MILFLILLASFTPLGFADNECASRAVKGQSVVCVCNSTYCDTLTRSKPASETYIAYQSSKSGLRFNKTSGNVEDYTSTSENLFNSIINTLTGNTTTTLKIDTNTTYQTIKGFGGAVTDAAAINWKNMSTGVQKAIVDAYFSETGIGYNIIRVPIGGTDCSTREYAYNELPENDTKLTNYTLTVEDTDYKIPMIQQSISASNQELYLIATTWSPPTWMKTNDAYYGFSRLKDDFYQTYADYHLKFIELYSAYNISIWAITTTNEPFNGVVPFARFNSLGWTPRHMGKFIEEHLGPTIRNSTFNDTKILSLDDQRSMAPIWFNWMVKSKPSVLDWIDGVAFHWYFDPVTPTAVMDDIHKNHPDKFLIGTEACAGSYPWETDVVIGSWSRAEDYAHDIIEDLNHYFVGWNEWNLCLNAQGGPNWAENYLDAPIIVYPEADEFVKQPMFYALGHFAKFLPRGSVRVGVELDGDLQATVFLTPEDTVVAVVYNKHSKSRKVIIQIGSKQVTLTVEAHSISTVEVNTSG